MFRSLGWIFYARGRIPSYHKKYARRFKATGEVEGCRCRFFQLAELLAIILRTGTKDESVLELAHRILMDPRGLRFLAEAALDELCEIRGMGLAKAAQVKAALELGRRLACLDMELKPVINSPQEASVLVMEEMCYLDREHFRVILLNTKNRVIGIDQVSVGTLNASLVHPREVFKRAVQKSAAAIILVHNHPSSEPSPSPGICGSHSVCVGGKDYRH